VNDSPGGSDRRARVGVADPFIVFLGAPPLASGPTLFALYAWAGDPPLVGGLDLPAGIGAACWPMPLTGGEPQPKVVWNATSRAVLGLPTRPSPPAAPAVIVNRPAGLGRPAEFALQGVVADPGSAGTRPASVTNAVRVRVE
jgi:hypothetical protein